MTPTVLLNHATTLVSAPTPSMQGVWARAAATLARQALETHLDVVLRDLAPGTQTAPARTRFLCLLSLHPDPNLAREVAYAWSALSRAIHHHAYELPPTVEELQRWISSVQHFVEHGRPIVKVPHWT